MNLRAFARVGIGTIIAAGAIWTLFAGQPVSLGTIEASLQSLGHWAPIVFVAGFAVATVLFIPGSIFGLAGGLLFGPLWGTAWNVIGGTLGAILAFLVARYIAGDWVARRTRGRLKPIVEGAEAEGWRFVALTRLVPIVPFNLLNYALGLTRIPLWAYVWATLVCMVPGSAAYAWLGYAGRAVIAGENGAVQYALGGLAVLALVVFAPRLVWRVRKASDEWVNVPELRRQLSMAAPVTIVDVREPDEFAGPLGHVPHARNIPLPELPAHIDTCRGPNKIVLVCRTDKRSAKAAELLRAAGVDRVQVLRGGMEAWSKYRAPAPPIVRADITE
ncbi:MAG: sulfurtransferase [Betaproteobacteria bacterium]|nr:sulfurtransferase [Betaproteobacteria bacterium]